MLAKVKPAVQMRQDFLGEKTSWNELFLRHISKNNVRHTLQKIREKRAMLNEMEDKGEIKIVGAFYGLTH